MSEMPKCDCCGAVIGFTPRVWCRGCRSDVCCHCVMDTLIGELCLSCAYDYEAEQKYPKGHEFLFEEARDAWLKERE